MSNSDIDCLCNEIDFYPIVGKSIIFLQGDFGNCYYCIASGKVSLYLEASKDREMAIGREFGALRGCKYENSSETLDSLGGFIYNFVTYVLTHVLILRQINYHTAHWSRIRWICYPIHISETTIMCRCIIGGWLLVTNYACWFIW